MKWSLVLETLNKPCLWSSVLSLQYIPTIQLTNTNNSTLSFASKIWIQCLNNIEIYHECKFRHSCNSDDSDSKERNSNYYDSDGRSYEVLNGWVVRVLNKANALLSTPAPPPRWKPPWHGDGAYITKRFHPVHQQKELVGAMLLRLSLTSRTNNLLNDT